MSPDSLCPHFGPCGGCSQQDRPYADQLQKKEALVRDALAGVAVQDIRPIVPSPEVMFYRNKMEFSFGDLRDVDILKQPKRKKGEKKKPPPLIPEGENKIHLGLHPRKRFTLVTPTPHCQLLSQESQQVCERVSAWATRHQIPTYTRHNHQGILRHLLIREGKNTGHRLVNLFATSALPFVDELAQELKDAGLPITTFLWTANDGLSDVAQGEPTQIFWGDGLIQERLVDCDLRIPSNAFAQTNTHAAEGMIRLLKQWVGDNQKESGQRSPLLFDLYCGSGSIGLNLVSHFDRLVGIELDANAIDQARQNARLNGCETTVFTQGRVEDLLSLISKEPQVDQSTLVVDPPRAGLHSTVVEALAESGVPTLYYVSCNPVSLGRDLQRLVPKYRIEVVQPMDFFPHTDHVETVVQCKRQS